MTQLKEKGTHWAAFRTIIVQVNRQNLFAWILMGPRAVICGTFCSDGAAGPRAVVLQGADEAEGQLCFVLLLLLARSVPVESTATRRHRGSDEPVRFSEI